MEREGEEETREGRGGNLELPVSVVVPLGEVGVGSERLEREERSEPDGDGRHGPLIERDPGLTLRVRLEREEPDEGNVDWRSESQARSVSLTSQD